MNLDFAKQRFEEISLEIESLENSIETEADVRFQIIDRVLTKVLGWERSEVNTERHQSGGYIDYLIGSTNRNYFVVEAKRSAVPLLDVANPKASFYSAGGPALKSAKEGLEQAQRYCSNTGVLFAAITNGFQWIGFWAIRTDGQPPLQGKAAVFPSLEAINDDFALFYELFSKEGLQADLFKVRVNEAEGFIVRHAEFLEPVLSDQEVRLMKQTKLGADLEHVFNRFFGSMSGDGDPEMLAHCFVETKESKDADATLAKITDNLINRIDVVDTAKGEELEEQIRHAIESERGEFVLIIGNKGAGKTTFIDRFFRLVLKRRLRERCVVLRLDLANSTGELETIVPWLVRRLRNEIERQLFDGRPPSYEELQGIFISEYDRWRHGERRPLYERDRNEFKEKFGEWIASLIEDQPEEYVRALLSNIVSGRKQMPCIIFDNTDHFKNSFQEAVFQFAQSLHREVFSFIVCPITDRTIWQLSKSGPFQSYNTRALYLPVPSTKDVLAKRITFVKEKAQGERGEYFLSKGIRLAVSDINAFASCIEEIFVNEDYIGRAIGWLSNHDIRRGLRIANRIITSPVLEVDDLVKAYLVGESAVPRRREIKKALLVGTKTHFSQEENDYILNLFEVEPDNLRSPLLRLSALRLLIDRAVDQGHPEKSYVSIGHILSYFESAGVSSIVLRQDLADLLKYRLITPYDPTDDRTHDEQRVKVTHAGRIHYEFVFAAREAIYMSEVALRTPVRAGSYLERARRIISSGKMGWSDWQSLIREFVIYILSEDEKQVKLPDVEGFSGQRNMRDELRGTWKAES